MFIVNLHYEKVMKKNKTIKLFLLVLKINIHTFLFYLNILLVCRILLKYMKTLLYYYNIFELKNIILFILEF